MEKVTVVIEKYEIRALIQWHVKQIRMLKDVSGAEVSVQESEARIKELSALLPSLR